MTSLTVSLDDDLVADLRRQAEQRGTAADVVVAEAVREKLEREASDIDLTPPPQILAEIRQRQQDGPEVGIPIDEAFDQIRQEFAARSAAAAKSR